MSGSGDGGGSTDDWRPPLGAGGGGQDRCGIVERTVLNSPNPDVIATLKAGQLLFIELELAPRKRVVAKIASGEVAGAITSPQLIDFIECLENDYLYEAEVKAVNGGRVEIEIRPR